MSKLPHIRSQSLSPEETARVQRWQRAWRMHLDLQGQAEEPSSADPASAQTGCPAGEPAFRLQEWVAPYDQDSVAVGDIRLLSPEIIDERAVYVAVLAEAEWGMWLVAPYGNFSEPCAPGELETGRKEAAFQVLCLWNLHSVPVELLHRSWKVDSLTEQELQEAKAVFQNVAAGRPLPEPLRARVGSPIFSQFDDRVVYQREEAALMAPLARAAQRRMEEVQLAWILDIPIPAHNPRPTGPEISRIRDNMARKLTEELTLAAAAAGGQPYSHVALFKGSLQELEDWLAAGGALNRLKVFTASAIVEPQPDQAKPSKCFAQWDLGALSPAPAEGDLFAVFDRKAKRFIGQGRVAQGGQVGSLIEGAWELFNRPAFRCQDLLLLLLRCGP